MTTDLTLKAIKAWIEHRATGDLADVPVKLRTVDEEQAGLQIVLKDEETEEHPILRGVLTIQATVMLDSVPGEEDQEATPLEDHEALASALYDILADTTAITFCDGQEGLHCYDIRGTAPTTEAEDGIRVTSFGMTIVAGKR